MQITEQDKACMPASLDEMALHIARQIVAIDRDTLIGGEVQLKAQVQVLVREALASHSIPGLAVYWHQRFQQVQARLERAEHALRLGGYVDLGAEHWKPPVNTVATELHQRLAASQQEADQLREVIQTMKDQAERDGYRPDYVIDREVQLRARKPDEPEYGVDRPLMFYTFTEPHSVVIRAGLEALRKASWCTILPERAARITITYKNDTGASLHEGIKQALLQTAKNMDDLYPTSTMQTKNGAWAKLEVLPTTTEEELKK